MGQGLPSLSRGDVANPIHVHPDDMAARGLAEGQIARLRSAHGFVTGAVRADETLRPGTLSLTHGFGGAGIGEKAADRGASIALLVGLDERDPVTGIPRMSAIPVTLEQTDAGSGSRLGM